MGIITGRIKTYTPGAVPSSAQFNAIQDRLSDNDQDLQGQIDQLAAQIEQGAHGEKTRYIAPIPDPGAVNFLYRGSYGYLEATGPLASCFLRLDVEEGDQITSLGFQGYGNEAGAITVRLYRSEGDSQIEVMAVQLEDPPGSWLAQVGELPVPHIVTADSHYTIGVEASLAGQRLRALRMAHRRSIAMA